MSRYCIALRGQVDIDDLNAISPHQISLVRIEPAETWVEICTDQSGMVGMLVHLHRMGVGLLSVRFVKENEEQDKNHVKPTHFTA